MAKKNSPPVTSPATETVKPAIMGIPLRDDPYAPIIYSTELAGGGQQGENFNLTFAVMLYDHGDGVTKAYRKTNLRLVLPIAAVGTAINFLTQLRDAHQEASHSQLKSDRVLQ